MRAKLLLIAGLCLLLSSTAPAADIEIRPVGGFSAAIPKGLGTAGAPLKLTGSLSPAAISLPTGADIMAFDGALVGLPATPESMGAQSVTPRELIRFAAAPQAITGAPLRAGQALDEQTGEPASERASSASGELGHAAAASRPEEKTQDAAPSEELGTQGEKTFDGAKTASAGAPGPVAAKTGETARKTGLFSGRLLKRILPKRLIERLAARRAAAQADKDPYGGPKKLDLDFKGKLAYGAKWAANLIGLQALLQFAAKSFEHIFAWQLHVSDAFLQSTGRVELLARVGPKALSSALAKDPWHFLFVQLPVATGWEEITGRLFGFGVLWTILAAIKPATGALSRWLESVPDLFNLRSSAQIALTLAGKASNKAFPIAAALSAASFAASHFAAWGVSPYFVSVHLTAGLALAYAAYKTRSLVVAFVAHYLFDALTLAAGVIALHFMAPLAAQIYSLLLGTAGAAYLYFNVRSYLKARAQAKAQARHDLLARAGKAVLPVLIAALAAGSFLPGTPRTADTAAATKAVQAWQVQRADAPAPVVPAAAPSQTGQANPGPEAAQDLAVAITAKTKPAVVKIFSGLGLGSGYIVSPEGITISNAHVVGAAKPGDILKLEFSDGSAGEIKVLAVNHDKDIAILQLPKNEKGWPFVPLGDSEGLVEGQQVLAMGYPLGLPFTVTRGIVSGLGGGRGSIYVQQLQTDAAINHGNSGGPLLNMKGEVIGMNTAIASPTQNSGSIGIGFSIVSEDIKAALAQFAATGNINTAAFGVIIDRANPDAPEQGILVEKVRPGSAAAKAGLAAGDLLLGVGGHAFPKGPHGLEMLARAIAQKKPGETMVVLVARGGDISPVTVTLQDVKP